MSLEKTAEANLSHDLLEEIAALPLHRDVTHCGSMFQVSPFEVYAICPVCKDRIKVRSFAAVTEIEDVFDAVFAWMNQPGAAELASQRRQVIASDSDRRSMP